MRLQIRLLQQTGPRQIHLLDDAVVLRAVKAQISLRQIMRRAEGKGSWKRVCVEKDVNNVMR